MKKIFLVSMSVTCLVVESSMLHRSLEYVDNPAGKAAVRKSVDKISNADLPKIADQAYRDLVSVDHDFIDSLINDERRADGYKPLGLVAEDIKEIEAFIRRFHLSGATQTGIVTREYLELPSLQLPKFLENEYDYKNYEIIDSIVSSDIYSYLGPKEIRTDVANYLFQKFNKDNKNIGKEKHLFVSKGKNAAYQETFKNKIRTTLNSMEKQSEYIGNLEEDFIDSDLLYLIVRPEDLTDAYLKKKLENILQDKNTNPALQVIIIFDDQQNQIPVNFRLSDNIRHVALVGKNVTSIGDFFLSGCCELRSVDLSGFKNVTSIGDYFLSTCCELRSVDLSGFKNVTSIGDFFLSICRELRSVDLSVFKNVTSIGNSFLSNCSELQSVDLSVFKNVTSIGNYFLSVCRELRSVDLSVFKNVTSIGNTFLSNCSELQSVDLSVFKNVISIGNYFLNGCSKLQSVDLSIFKNITSIGNSFLSNCSELRSVDLSVFKKVISIGDFFLGGCSKLQSVDLSVFKNVISIGSSFLSYCHSLHDVTIDENLIKLLPAKFFDQFLELKKENIRVINLNSVNED